MLPNVKSKPIVADILGSRYSIHDLTLSQQTSFISRLHPHASQTISRQLLERYLLLRHERSVDETAVFANKRTHHVVTDLMCDDIGSGQIVRHVPHVVDVNVHLPLTRAVE